VAEPSPPRWHLLRHAEAVACVRQRAAALASVRQHFADSGFLEADVPLLLPHAGQEPWLHPPSVSAPGLPPLWLQTSPELPLKRLLCGGLERIYSLGPAFRGGREELSRLHQPQFSMLEWYEPGSRLDQLVERCRALGRALAGALHRPAPPDGEVLSLDEACRRWGDVSIAPLLDGDRAAFVAQARRVGLLLDAREHVAQLVGRLLVERVEPGLATAPGWVFVRDYPAELASLARLDPADPRQALRVEAYLGGVELANGYVELRDAETLARRWQQEAAVRDGLPPPQDETLLAEMAAGRMPECVGMALGFDRLLMVLAGGTSLADVLPLSLQIEDAAPP